MIPTIAAIAMISTALATLIHFNRDTYEGRHRNESQTTH